MKDVMAERYGWTLEYIDELEYTKFIWLTKAWGIRKEVQEKQNREIEEKSKRRKR